jgi:hypothetical protein
MGSLYYGPREIAIHIEDRTLAHLRVVVTTKFRRNEAFALSLQHRDGEPGDHTTLWLHPAIPLRFVFDEPERTDLSRAWMEELVNAANTTAGIHLTDDHADGPAAYRHAHSAGEPED